MALTSDQQFKELITKAEHVLITFRKNYTGDALASALALARFLSGLNKKCTIVADDFKMAPEFSFLPNIYSVANSLEHLRHFLIEVNLAGKKVSEFSYDVNNDKMMIYLLPEKGEFKPEDAVARHTGYRFDLIITLDAPDLESLGKVYSQEPDFFFQTTIVNIDHNLNNENYGQLNLVDPNKSSVAEIIYDLINNWQRSLVDAELATIILAGMIHKTQSFRLPNLAPKTLAITSDLIDLGADREKIVANFYCTKKIATLKLWGRVLARLQLDQSLKLAWASVPYTDFVKTGASPEDLNGLAEEMILNTPQTEIFVLLYETAVGNIFGSLHTKHHDAKWLLNNFGGEGTKEKAVFELPDKILTEAEMKVVNEIRKKIVG